MESNEIKQIVQLALNEDAPSGDITSEAIFPKEGKPHKGYFIAKEDLILSGLEAAQQAFELTNKKCQVKWLKKDGNALKKGTIFGRIEGPIGALLQAERIALNFLQHLSGVATQTNQFVKAISPYKARILDTRKTIPGLRLLEKRAVVHGGGCNHRLNLSTDYLIKDNHIAACGSVAKTIQAIQAHKKLLKRKNLTIEVEVKNIQELKEALAENPDIILLDNMTLSQIRQAVKISKGQALLEVSGGVNIKTVRGFAATGVDRISIGRLTHSVTAVDISLEIEN